MGKARRNHTARAARVRGRSPARSVSLRRRTLVSRTRATIMSFLPTLLLFLGARQLLAEAYRIPSGSMEPTLLVGDRLFVNKLRLGPHIPFTNQLLPGYAAPQRGDIVVFISPPQDPSIRITPDDVTPMLVKRIVGIGGDTLLMRHGQLIVNGTVVPSPNAFVLADSLADVPQSIFGWQHAIEIRGSRFGPAPAVPSLHEWGPLVVPAGTYFMMGDNRDNSVDSRYYGPVPRANLRGTPMFIYYSYDPDRGMDYVRAVTAIRWSRIGHWIR
jgi:signal peptidase I